MLATEHQISINHSQSDLHELIFNIENTGHRPAIPVKKATKPITAKTQPENEEFQAIEVNTSPVPNTILASRSVFPKFGFIKISSLSA
jgi:hypothetical protein